MSQAHDPEPPLFILAMAGLAAHIIGDKYHEIVFVGRTTDEPGGTEHEHEHGAHQKHQASLLIPTSVELTWSDGQSTWPDGTPRVVKSDKGEFNTLDPRGHRLTFSPAQQSPLTITRLTEEERKLKQPDQSGDPTAWASVDWLLPLQELYPTGTLRAPADWTEIGGAIRLTSGDVVCELKTGSQHDVPAFDYVFQAPDAERGKVVPEWVVNRVSLRDLFVVVDFSPMDDPSAVVATLTLRQTSGPTLALAAVNVNPDPIAQDELAEHIDLYRSSLFDNAAANDITVAEAALEKAMIPTTAYRQALIDLADLVSPVFPGPRETTDTPRIGCPRAVFFQAAAADGSAAPNQDSMSVKV